MNVESPAGNFVLSFERMDPGDGDLVITGKMGLWEAKTHMTLPEFVAILGMTMRPRILFFLIKCLFTGAFFRRSSG
jgi:hypothetical protein